MTDSSASAEGSAVAGRLPVLPDERVFTTFGGFARTCVAFGSAIWVFLIGGFLPATGSTHLGILGYAAGLIIGFVPVVLASGLPSFRTGTDTIDACKSAFGARGAYLPLFGVQLTSIGWSCVIMSMIARGGPTLWVHLAEGPQAEPAPLAVIVCGFVVIGVCWRLVRAGPERIQRVNNLVGPGLIVLALVSLVLLGRRFGLSHLWHQDVPVDKVVTRDHLAGVSYAVEFGIATSLAWWPFLGGMYRLVKYRRHVVTPSMVGLTVVGGAFGAGVAALASVAFGTADPLVWVVALAGPSAGSAIVIVILLANLAVMGLMIYLGAVAARQVPVLTRLPWGLLVAVMLVPAGVAAFSTQWVIDHVLTVTTYVGLSFVGVTAVTLVDYLLLRRQRVSAADLFARPGTGRYWFWGGFNWVALASVAVSAAVYFALYDPLTLQAAPAFRWAGASLPAMLASGAFYYVVMRAVVMTSRRGGYRPHGGGGPVQVRL